MLKVLVYILGIQLNVLISGKLIQNLSLTAVLDMNSTV